MVDKRKITRLYFFFGLIRDAAVLTLKLFFYKEFGNIFLYWTLSLRVFFSETNFKNSLPLLSIVYGEFTLLPYASHHTRSFNTVK